MREVYGKASVDLRLHPDVVTEAIQLSAGKVATVVEERPGLRPVDTTR